jgi:hypothetical protein
LLLRDCLSSMRFLVLSGRATHRKSWLCCASSYPNDTNTGVRP